MNEPVNRFIGVDVQTARRCPYVVLDDVGKFVDAGWFDGNDYAAAASALKSLASGYKDDQIGVAVGIDAPRCPLLNPRAWYWRSKGQQWRQSRSSDQGAGRHCEVVISALRLANPQWTPHRQPFPAWMELGFRLFQVLGEVFPVYEVFPSASYKLLDGDKTLTVEVRLGDLAQGPKDMLDAFVSAATVREFLQGRGCSVGGGDGYGEIILPRRHAVAPPALLRWPPTANSEGSSKEGLAASMAGS